MVIALRMRASLRAVGLFFLILSFAFFANGTTVAQTNASLRGTVFADGHPVTGATVTITGNGENHRVTSAAGGIFTIALPPGTYVLAATNAGRTGTARAVLGAGGAAVAITLTGLAVIGQTAGSASALQAQHSGTDTTITAQTLARSPSGTGLSEALLQVPGAARGANGVVHINGDHGDVNYVVDGVSLPQELNRVIGNEVDTTDIANAQILEGAYPAQYGEKFAAVVDIGTKTGNGPAGWSLDGSGGSYGSYDGTFGYHTPIGPGGSLSFASSNSVTDRGLDPPSLGSPHNNASDANQYLRIELPNHGDFVDLLVTHSLQTFQIPPDVSQGASGFEDDDEYQNDLYAALQYRHPIGDHGSLSFGPSYKQTKIVDTPDFENDIAFGIANGGIADCSTSFDDPSAPACSNSVYANRTSTDYRFSADYSLRSAHHEIRAGAVYDNSEVTKDYAVTLQPNNPYSSQPSTITDTAPNTGHTVEAYLQDSWHLGALYQLDYGLRYDTFQLFSDQFLTGAGMTSPRVKLTRLLGSRASVYAYYGRFFTPYSFENVSPAAAALIVPQSGNFDLLPQRDSDYELGFHVPAGRGDLGVRVAQKDATNLIDDTQIGFTNLHQDINYALGRIATQSAYYQLPLARSGRVYAAFTHTYSVVKNCETELLAPCFSGPALDWVPADHDQHVDITSGTLLNDRRGGWFAADGEYGSGLTSSYCMPLNDNCKVPPHITFDVEKGFGVPHGAITVGIRNLFNDDYLITYLNAQGNHYARPRTLTLGFQFNGR